MSIKSQILFIGSNPLEATRLRIDQEARDIEEGLKRAKNRADFGFKTQFAVRPKDLIRAILDEEPVFLHFSGHGEMEGIYLEDELGEPKLADTHALTEVFSLFKDSLKCVLLNSCYSEYQAQSIASHIPYVIGMSSAIPDRSAIVFAIGFYDAIGAGRDIEFAFKLGVASIELEGLSGAHIPKLYKHASIKG